jgi:hypothetical protein
MATASELIQGIAKGEFDTQLDEIAHVIGERRRYLRLQKGLQNRKALKPGTPCRITPGIKPKYLTGLTGKVSEQAPTRSGDLMFEFDDESYLYVAHRFRRIVGVPASLLARI